MATTSFLSFWGTCWTPPQVLPTHSKSCWDHYFSTAELRLGLPAVRERFICPHKLPRAKVANSFGPDTGTYVRYLKHSLRGIALSKLEWDGAVEQPSNADISMRLKQRRCTAHSALEILIAYALLYICQILDASKCGMGRHCCVWILARPPPRIILLASSQLKKHEGERRKLTCRPLWIRPRTPVCFNDTLGK